MTNRFDIRREWNDTLRTCIEEDLEKLEQCSPNSTNDYNKSYAQRLIDRLKQADANDIPFSASRDQVGFILAEVLPPYFNTDGSTKSEKIEAMRSEMKNFCFNQPKGMY